MSSRKTCLLGFSLSSLCALATILGVLHCATAILVDRTIDDEHGDSATGTKPIYTPADGWVQGANCDACAVNSSLVNSSQVFSGTWHSITSGTGERTITMNFTGTAIDVFFVIARSAPSTLAQTNLTFTLDTDPTGKPLSNDGVVKPVQQFPTLWNGMPMYTVRMFSLAGIPNEEHTLSIYSAGATNSLYAFDFAQYVTNVDTDPTSSAATSLDLSTGQATSLLSTNTLSVTPTSAVSDAQTASFSTTSRIGALVGGIIGGLALVTLAVAAFVLRRRKLRGRQEKRNGAAGGGGDDKDGLGIFPALFAHSRSASRSSSEDCFDELPGSESVYVRSPPAAYAMFAQHLDSQGNTLRHSAPDGHGPLGSIPNAHGSRVSLPPSYAINQPTDNPEALQRASSPSGMSHHTVLPPYSSAPPSLAYAGARRHVELTRLIRVLEGQLRTHDALHLSRLSALSGSHDPQTTDPSSAPEKPTRRARGRERAEARRRAEEAEYASRRERLAALLSELTEARTLLVEEAQVLPTSEPASVSSPMSDPESS